MWEVHATMVMPEHLAMPTLEEQPLPDITPATTEYRLYAAVSTEPWVPGENHAVCRSPVMSVRGTLHVVAGAHCTCGLYASKSPLALGFSSSILECYSGYAIGTVEMYGVVSEHAFGWRASCARVVSIHPLSAHAKELARVYDVPLSRAGWGDRPKIDISGS